MEMIPERNSNSRLSFALLQPVAIGGAKRQAVNIPKLFDLLQSLCGERALPSNACSTIPSSRSPRLMSFNFGNPF